MELCRGGINSFGNEFVQHHDLVPMPNGNVLFTAWERHTPQEAIDMGHDPATLGNELWSEIIYEVEPVGATGGNIVWSWRAWDNLVQDFDPTKPNFGNPADYPGRIDINYTHPESIENWMHANALDYNEDLDQIVVSIRHWHEVWVIDHAPGASGELLYRYGNPVAYGRGTPADRILWGSHNCHWIKPGLPGAGNLLMFNNGFNFSNLRDFSTIEEVITPLNPRMAYDLVDGQPFQPTSPTFIVDRVSGEQFFSNIMSSAQRLPNGNTFVCLGRPGRLFEYDENNVRVWEQNINQITFYAQRIGTFDNRLEGYMWESVGTDTFNIDQGLLWSGGLQEMAASDDQHLEIRLNSGPIVVTIQGELDVIQDPAKINVQLESKHFLATDTRRPVTVDRQIELLNYDTGSFDVVGATVSTVSDSVMELTIDKDAADYIDPSTGSVEARLSFSRTGLSRGIRVEIDRAEVRVVR